MRADGSQHPHLWRFLALRGFAQVIHNAGVRGSSPCVATKFKKGSAKAGPFFCACRLASRIESAP